MQYLHSIIVGTDRSAQIAEAGSFLFIAGKVARLLPVLPRS